MAGPYQPLLEHQVDPDPLVQFGRWYEEASAVMASPEAMVLASAGADGRPSARMVLLKGWGEDGFVFHTNYGSRKGDELEANPHAALLFYWEPQGRQVRIEGSAERTGEDESDTYFTTRPRGGQIGAHASRQSRPVESREQLDARVEDVRTRFEGRPVPRPPWWGGMKVIPERFEFWQNREDRLHDRLCYSPRADGSTGWSITRLQP